MIVLHGNFYDGNTSAKVPAECRVYDNGAVRVHAAGSAESLLSLSRFDLSASPRLAHTPRSLYFPDGQKFETGDNRTVDELLKRFDRRSRLHLVHLLESRKRYILLCLAAMAAVVWGAGVYGFPWAAEVIARRLPASLVRKVGGQTLEVLDRSVFTPSRLEAPQLQQLQRHFQPLLEDHPEENLRVVFRRGGRLGANAFALPDGTLILTDEMVALAASPEELTAVLAHEAGHVVHRHGIRRIIQGSLLSFALMAVTGDASGTSQMFLGLPVMLTELAYSREFEREADRHALDYLRSRGMAPVLFANLMRRLEDQTAKDSAAEENGWSNYLSTHPAVDDRLQDFEIPD